MSCEACGHIHQHMAAIYSGNKIISLCHEDDHSCYEEWEDPERDVEILRRALNYALDPHD